MLGPVFRTSLTHLIPRKTLWVLLCPFYKLGACYQVKFRSNLAQSHGEAELDLGPVCPTPEPIPSITTRSPGPERAGTGRGIHRLCLPRSRMRCGWKKHVVSPPH